MATLGYVLTSTREQEAGLQAQIRDLIAAGCAELTPFLWTQKTPAGARARDSKAMLALSLSYQTLHQPPQTSRATSTMSASFAFCSSIVSAFPSTVDEKPHCGLRQSCSSGTYRAASSMRRFNSSLASNAGRLVVTRPSTTFFGPRGTKRKGAKPPERWSSYSRKKPSTAR